MIRRCSRCLMVNLRPDTEFLDSVCSGCVNYERRSQINWAERKETLLRILESAPKNDSGFDVIVPSSGQKDSTYQVLRVLELGARPLVVTATTCMLTPIGRANIDNLSRYASTVEITPDRTVRAKLNRIGLELVGDLSVAEHWLIHALPWRAARDFGIPTIMYGEVGPVEYGGPLDLAETQRMTRRFVAEFGGNLGLRPADLVGQYGLRREDMALYQLPPQEDTDKINAYFLGSFYPWNSHKNAQMSVKAGMMVPDEPPSIANWWTPENIDNFQTGIHDWFGAVKYSYGRLCAQISVDIRYGLISREEAATIVRERDCVFPEYYMGMHYTKILEHIELPEPRFWELTCQYANKALFDISSGRPVMKPEVWEASFA